MQGLELIAQVHQPARGQAHVRARRQGGQFIEALGVTSIPELYALDKEQLVALDRFGEKKAQNLLDAIEKSKTRPLSAFLFALGIPNVGSKTAKDLAKRFGTLSAVRAATREELE